MLNKDIFHEIIMRSDICDLINIYLGLHPVLDIKYYINSRKAVGRAVIYGVDVIYSYVRTNKLSNVKYSTLYITGSLHRDDDEPAVTYSNGIRVWYKYGKIHRDGDEPAILIRGSRIWYKYGRIHRDGDEPAAIYRGGVRIWYKGNVCHRGDDLPAITYPGGRYEWFIHGKLVRSNGRPLL